jgi:23S rRNA pseudouridine2457 synthase
VAKLIILNKPYLVLSQFTDQEGRATLADWIDTPSVYPAGRLDYDSEGLLLLTDDGQLQQRISDPRHKMSKRYWVQVEGVPSPGAIHSLCSGVELNDGMTAAASVTSIKPPADLWPRTPPIRQRKEATTSWIEVVISEGRNRQVRRMTAAVGHPTLRLIRPRIGEWSLNGLQPGQFREITVNLPAGKTKPWGGRRHTRAKL